mgnify:CR=1 FL=1
MYYAVYENENVKRKNKEWIVCKGKKEVFDFFNSKYKNMDTSHGDIVKLNNDLDRWEIAQLTADTRKKLEQEFGKDNLHGKGEYFPEIVSQVSKNKNL